MIIHGDCLVEMPKLGVLVDAVVCDPPYDLNFMNRSWDRTGIAMRPETWAAVADVMKPGAHLVVFGGSRTFHRVACAIEDAGLEIRDTIMWLYGSGFPKSHDVSKGIDKRRDWTALPKLHAAIKAARQAAGISQSEAARRMGLIASDASLGGGGFMWFETGMRMPTRQQWPNLKATLSLGDQFDATFEEAEREITGTVEEWTNRTNYALTSRDGFRRDNPATDAARQWEGWGTALKPAHEPIILARKPLTGTVAQNVLLHGTGALNIDGCRVAADWENDPNKRGLGYGFTRDGYDKKAAFANSEARTGYDTTKGRWPANIVHDGSDEVLEAFAAFGSDKGAAAPVLCHAGTHDNIYQPAKGYQGDGSTFYSDTGTAARFFYCAKASAADRAGSKHPTVKPLSLMRWLCRLVTPPGGLILDPFAGSGTTLQAAYEEGFRAIGIEREAEYFADIEKRMALARQAAGLFAEVA